MKNKVIMLLLVITTIGALGFAYYERLKVNTLIGQVSKLRKEVKEAEYQATVVRIEASKLRFIIENEKRRTDGARKLTKN